jgi:hypothetical protein
VCPYGPEARSDSQRFFADSRSCCFAEEKGFVLGFSMAARRSELVTLDVEDLTFTSDGLVVAIKRSKTDQEGQGRRVRVPFGSTPATCPVRALKRWLEEAYIQIDLQWLKGCCLPLTTP